LENKPIDDRELLQIVSQEYQAADSYINSGAIAAQRSQSMNYYMGFQLGNEVKGRSQVISRDVFETIEWIMPQLMEILVSDTAVEFEPEGTEDIEIADQATAWCQHVLYKENDGFLLLHDWIKDGLLHKKSYAKSYWEVEKKPKLETYTDIDEEELGHLILPNNTKIVELTNKGKQDFGSGPVQSFDAKIATIDPKGHVCITVPAPEDILVRRGTVKLDDTDYVSEVFEATASQLRNMGFPEDVIAQVKFGQTEQIWRNQVRQSRNAIDDSNTSLRTAPHNSLKTARLVETYIALDRDGDGYNEMLQVIHDESGTVILSVAEVDSHPYNDLDIIRIPHKHHGLSIGDIMADLQEIKSVLTRGILDNTYFSLNGRWAVLDEQVNLSDLTNPIPGGIVRERISGAVRPLETPKMDASTFSLMEYVDHVRERRAGVNEVQQGVDKTALGSNVASGALDRAMKASQARILLMARMIAETGIKKLMLRLYEIGRKNQIEDKIIRLRGKFVKVNPRDWKDRADMSVNVGVGNTSPQEKLTQLGIVRDTMAMAHQSGAPIVVPEGAYNLAVEFVKATGRHDYGRFFVDPGDPTAPKPPDPGPSFDQQIAMEKNQIERDKLDLENRKFDWQKVVDAAEVALEDQQKRAVGIEAGNTGG
jgi:hypothetical protein